MEAEQLLKRIDNDKKLRPFLIYLNDIKENPDKYNIINGSGEIVGVLNNFLKYNKKEELEYKMAISLHKVFSVIPEIKNSNVDDYIETLNDSIEDIRYERVTLKKLKRQIKKDKSDKKYNNLEIYSYSLFLLTTFSCLRQDRPRGGSLKYRSNLSGFDYDNPFDNHLLNEIKDKLEDNFKILKK